MRQINQSAVSPQQSLPQLEPTTTSNVLTGVFVEQPTQLEDANAQVFSSASRRSIPSERLGFRRDQILEPSPAIKLIVTARTTAPSRYDSSAWRSTVALMAVNPISVSETWKVIPTV